MMQALRTIIWIIVAVVLTIFAVANSQPVTVAVWPGSVAELPLSILVILVFLLGFLPPFLFNLGNRWRLGRKITQQEQMIAQLRPTIVAAPVAAPVVESSILSTTDGTPT